MLNRLLGKAAAAQGVPPPITYTITSGGGGTGQYNMYSRRSGDTDGSITPSPLELAPNIIVNRVRKNISGSFAQILLNRTIGIAFSAWSARFPNFKITLTVTGGSVELNAGNADSLGGGFARWNLDAAGTNVINGISTGDTITLRISYDGS